ncbi:MAG TPA: flagellar hook-associated protein FlgK [Bryocella sp.]|nr:flagellar hook-associated protein FlgK [Bryocella sp.]
MGGLVSTMGIALGALEAQQAGMEVTTNNIANLDTPGYSRERLVVEEADPFVQNGIALGDGVNVTGVESLRDTLLNLQVNDEIQQQSKSQTYVNTMNQVQTLFPDDTTGIGQSISAFFQSINSLSTDPADPTLRESVLSAAGNMASAFNTTATQLSSTRQQLNQVVDQQVQQINQLSSQVAALNVQITGAGTSSNQSTGSLLDQRDSLVQQLSQLVDLSQIQDGNSLTLTTQQGAALVVGGQSYALSTENGSDGTQHVFSAQGNDITGEISGGELGGTLEARDQTIPDLQTQLDSLASGLVQALNSANAMGTDLNGNPGGNLFDPVSGAGAAANMTLAISDPSLIAASSDGTSGSNGNLANFSAVANQAVADGETPSDCYADLVFQAGTAVENGNAELTASGAMLQQLQQQQSAVSGVSLDEEASNLLLYQRGYQAAAEAVTAVSQMLETAINMGAVESS